MKYLILFLFLCCCGETDEKQTFQVGGEERKCTIIDEKPCGLTLACENAGLFECFSN